MDTVSISGTITLADDLTVVNDVYFNAEVTIGDASTVTMNRTAIVASNSVTGVAVFNGFVTLGDASTDSITVNGVTTVNDGRCDRAVRVR